MDSPLQIANFAVNGTRHSPELRDCIEAEIERLIEREKEVLRTYFIKEISNLDSESFDKSNVRIILKNFRKHD